MYQYSKALASAIYLNFMMIKFQGKGFRLDPFGVNESRRLTGDRKEIAVIIPIYNNGRYLQGRCFRSLLRSSVFDKMQIYLIDDGSDDEETLAG